MSEPNAAIRIRSLTKRYGDVEAIRGIELDVWASEIFGLIGPDGAGKTSTFQILGGVMEATSGAAELLGQPARQARAYVGYLTQAFSLYQDLSVAENLRYVGELRGVPVREIEQRGQHYLAMFGMERFTDRLAGRLSGGMKQKLALACALVAEPRILLLDEPTTGVDPVSRREFWDALAQLSSQGITILLATPYLDEAERCHRVALMHEGRLHQVGTPAELRQSLGLQRLEVHATDLRRAETTLAERNGIVDVQRFGDRLDVLVRDVPAGERAVREALAGAGLAVGGVRGATPTLENTFVALLRRLQGEARVPPFPGRRDNGTSEDAVAIGARGLRKVFGGFEAVRGIHLEVRYGEVYGLLGANGAGKTTTIKMLCGLLEPSAGEVQLAGEVGALRSENVRQQVGYMSQKFSLYDDLTINENLDFFAGIYRVPPERRGDHARATRAVPRRADVGSGPDRPPCVLGHDQPARRSGHRDPGHHALPGRGRAVQPAGLHGGRRARGRGHAERREGGPGRPRARNSRRQPVARRRRAQAGDGAVARVAVRRPLPRHRRRRRAGRRAPARGTARPRRHPRPRGNRAGLLARGRLSRHCREGRARRLTVLAPCDASSPRPARS